METTAKYIKDVVFGVGNAQSYWDLSTLRSCQVLLVSALWKKFRKLDHCCNSYAMICLHWINLMRNGTLRFGQQFNLTVFTLTKKSPNCELAFLMQKTVQLSASSTEPTCFERCPRVPTNHIWWTNEGLGKLVEKQRLEIKKKDEKFFRLFDEYPARLEPRRTWYWTVLISVFGSIDNYRNLNSLILWKMVELWKVVKYWVNLSVKAVSSNSCQLCLLARLWLFIF